MIRIGTPPKLPRAGGLRRRLASYMFCVSSVLGVYSRAITSVGRCSGDFRLRLISLFLISPFIIRVELYLLGLFALLPRIILRRYVQPFSFERTPFGRFA